MYCWSQNGGVCSSIAVIYKYHAINHLVNIICIMKNNIQYYRKSWIKKRITRQKDVPHFYKWRVPILAIGSGHISPASLKRSGRFFAKWAKNLSVKSCYNAALRSLNIEAAESIYVDDYDIEAQGARDLGFTSFHIDRSRDKKNEWMIQSLKEIIDYVER